MDLSQNYDSLYDRRGRANLGEASSGKISGKINVSVSVYLFTIHKTSRKYILAKKIKFVY